MRTPQFWGDLNFEFSLRSIHFWVVLRGRLNFELSKSLITLRYSQAKRLQEQQPAQDWVGWRRTQSWACCANGYISVPAAYQSKVGLISMGAALRPLPLHKMNKSEPIAHRNNRWAFEFGFTTGCPYSI